MIAWQLAARRRSRPWECSGAECRRHCLDFRAHQPSALELQARRFNRPIRRRAGKAGFERFNPSPIFGESPKSTSAHERDASLPGWPT